MKGLPETKIPFATHAWCVATGCNEDLPCADNCWAKRDAARMANHSQEEIARRYRGLVTEGSGFGVQGSGLQAEPQTPNAERRTLRWAGDVREFPEFLDAPSRLRDPAVIFVGTHTDLGLVSAHLRCRVFHWMQVTADHQYLVVTKRWPKIAIAVGVPERSLWSDLPNVTVCLSCGTQEDFDVRMAQAVGSSPYAWGGRVAAFLEPQLEPIDVSRWVGKLSWVVQGCESLGRDRPGRPFEWEWATLVSEQCRRAGVPYWMKQGQAWVCARCGTWVRDREEYCPVGECRGPIRHRVIHNPWLWDAPSQEAPIAIADILNRRKGEGWCEACDASPPAPSPEGRGGTAGEAERDGKLPSREGEGAGGEAT